MDIIIAIGHSLQKVREQPDGSPEDQADPRFIVYVRDGANEPRQNLPVPTSSWTRNPDTLKEGV